MSLTQLHQDFAAHLKTSHLGRGRSITSKELRAWGTGADIREMVNSLRSEGVPICSSTAGYYYAETKEDVQGTMLFLESYVKNIQRAQDGLLQSLPTLNLTPGG